MVERLQNANGLNETQMGALHQELDEVLVGSHAENQLPGMRVRAINYLVGIVGAGIESRETAYRVAGQGVQAVFAHQQEQTMAPVLRRPPQ